MGRAAAFSFYPGKNLGACGEAGAATTNDAGIAKTMKMLRDHGQATKYYHDVEGYNGRLDSIQAGLLHVKLAHLAKWNAQRRERAAEYKRLLKAVDRRFGSTLRAVVVARSLSPLCGPNRRSRRPDGASQKSRHRHRDSLPDPAAPAESLCIHAIQPRRLPRSREGRRGNRFFADVPAAYGGPARPSGRGSP